MTIPFPFEEITSSPFSMEATWDLRQFAGFLDSWSATQSYQAQERRQPLEIIWDELAHAWGGEDQPRLVRWPLHFRIGRNVWLNDEQIAEVSKRMG